jgi:hypothetical protein
MTNRQPTDVKNLDIYGNAPLEWNRAVALLDQFQKEGGWGPSFLGTVSPDGRPHSAGFGPAWYDRTIYFVSGPGTLKSRNLAQNPACTVSMSLKGMDLIFEGTASRVTDPALLEQLAAVYRDQGGWPAQVEGDAFTAPFSAPSAGPPPWNVYRFDLRTAFGVASEEPHGATRWRFSE